MITALNKLPKIFFFIETILLFDFRAVFQSLVEKQFPALARSDTDLKKQPKVKSDLPTTSRKRTAVQKFKFEKRPSRKRKVMVKKSLPRRHVKRARIDSSSEEDFTMDELFKRDASSESDYEDNELSSDSEDGVKMEPDDDSVESDFHPSDDSDISDDEGSVSSELSIPSEGSASDSESDSESNIKSTQKSKSKAKVSKVQ